jgi:prevent-host-death family protein
MKASRKAGAPEVISTHEMRSEFERVLRAVKAGRSLTLTHRSKPLARIVPLREEQTIAEDDPIFRLDELAEPIGPLTNAEIDALVYGHTPSRHWPLSSDSAVTIL